MKRKSLLILTLAFLGLLTLTQCLNSEDPRPTEATKTTELNISPAFDWSLTSEIELSVIGIPGAIDNRKTLVVQSEGSVYFKELYNINQNITRIIRIPATVENVLVTYGDYSKSFSTAGGKIVLNFIPELPEE